MGALEEYLKDPNFEQNRIEYRDNKALADKSEREPSKATKCQSYLSDYYVPLFKCSIFA